VSRAKEGRKGGYKQKYGCPLKVFKWGGVFEKNQSEQKKHICAQEKGRGRAQVWEERHKSRLVPMCKKKKPSAGRVTQRKRHKKGVGGKTRTKGAAQQLDINVVKKRGV